MTKQKQNTVRIRTKTKRNEKVARLPTINLNRNFTVGRTESTLLGLCLRIHITPPFGLEKAKTFMSL